MKKRILIVLLSVLAFLPVLKAETYKVSVSICKLYMNDQIFTTSDNHIRFPVAKIEMGVMSHCGGAVENAEAIVYSAYNEPLAKGKITAFDHEVYPDVSGYPLGEVWVEFDAPLVLPKGKQYKVVVPAGSVYHAYDSSYLNEEFSCTFVVPKTVRNEETSVKEGSVVTKADKLGFGFVDEIAPTEEGKVILYRENIPLKEYPVSTWAKYNTRYVGIDFGKYMQFEDGTKYTVRLPEGSVGAKYRPDISNEGNSLTLNYVGGSTEKFRPVKYYSTTLDEFRDNCRINDVCGELKLYYHYDVSLSVTPVMKLTEDGVVVKEVVPVLVKDGKKWVLTADFENTPVNPDKSYCVVLPESTLFSEDEAIVVNSEEVFSVTGTTGVGEIEGAEFAVSAENGVVAISGVTEGSDHG